MIFLLITDKRKHSIIHANILIYICIILSSFNFTTYVGVRSRSLQLGKNTGSVCFSLSIISLLTNWVFPFPQWIPWSAFLLNDTSPGKYLSSLSSIHWVLLKDCLGLSGLFVIYWATCSDPTFLGDHDPKCREVATCNIGSVWVCCHLCFSLHLVPSTSLTINTLINSSPKLLSPLFIY